MAISVIVPVHQSARPLERCLAGLARSTESALEIIVVDDASTDGSDAMARKAGARVLSVARGPAGPAAARNLGAAAACGDILMFVDADVVVHPDTLARMADYLRDRPDVAAVFGSYDDRPYHRNLVSQYRNLLHHFVHQHGRREASTFWAGCGAVRRHVFAEIGGFDERYARPSVEDIELGVRLRQAGHRIHLCPHIQATHLKRWTFVDVVRSDIADRAIPWTRLILREGLPSDLNTARTSRLSAVAAWTSVLGLAGTPVWPSSIWVAIAGVSGVLLLNVRLYAVFLRRGVRVAVAGGFLHGLYLLYSSAAFGTLAAIWTVRRRGRLPDAAPAAGSIRERR